MVERNSTITSRVDNPRPNDLRIIFVAFVKMTTAALCREAEGRDELFVSTRWTIVLKAGESAATSVQSLNALSELCRIYWRPLYVFLRKKGYGHEDAQDLTQGFSLT